MRPGIRATLLLEAAFLLVIAVRLPAAPGPAAMEQRVVILANSLEAESVELAGYYASRRHIPRENIIALPMPGEETITWQLFAGRIWTPLFSELLKAGWVDAVPMDLQDPAGRRKYAVNSHRISYLVVCRGVPLRIAQDPALEDKAIGFPLAAESQLQTNQACVDSELTLLAMGTSPLISFVPNPLFRNAAPSFLDKRKLVQVSRLDGPDKASAMALVDHAIEAEQTGLIGRAYVDAGGPYIEGDHWFLSAERQLDVLGYDFDADHGSGVFPDHQRFDAPVIYLGWYRGDIDGPMKLPGFRFPAGAIAYHLHSSSAFTLRDPQRGWVGPLVARGATASFGNVHEPYLVLCQRPELLLQALAAGFNFGDAAYFSLPGLSWQNLIVGDPLYRPFAQSLDAQWAQRRQLSPRQAAYVTLRKMRLLDLAGKSEQAMEVGLKEASECPSLVLSLALAKRFLGRGQKVAALERLRPYTATPWLSSDDTPLLLECVSLFTQTEAWREGLSLSYKMMEYKEINNGQRLALLRHRLICLRALGSNDEYLRCQQEIDGLLKR